MNDLGHTHPQAMSGDELTALFQQVSNWGRWGPDDERGALNHIGSAEVARAAALVREGRTVSLSRDFPTQPGPENPWPAQHHMVIAGDDPCVPGVDGLEVSTDYIGIAFHGMASSHIDALCHVFAQGRMYNGHPATDVKSTGARRNTIMAARDGIVGRGVLLDVPRALGVPFMDSEHLTTAAELQATEAALGVTVGKGDLLMVRLGRDVRRAATADQAVPGLDPRVVAWLHERQVAMLGGDGPRPHPLRRRASRLGHADPHAGAGRHGPAPDGQPRPGAAGRGLRRARAMGVPAGGRAAQDRRRHRLAAQSDRDLLKDRAMGPTTMNAAQIHNARYVSAAMESGR
jgi:hypothetical protein